jgi:hypothetical protein
MFWSKRRASLIHGPEYLLIKSGGTLVVGVCKSRTGNGSGTHMIETAEPCFQAVYPVPKTDTVG